MHTIVGDVFVKDDGFLVNWFEFSGNGNACSGSQTETELTLVRGSYSSNQRRRGRTRCMLRASSELGQHGVGRRLLGLLGRIDETVGGVEIQQRSRENRQTDFRNIVVMMYLLHLFLLTFAFRWQWESESSRFTRAFIRRVSTVVQMDTLQTRGMIWLAELDCYSGQCGRRICSGIWGRRSSIYGRADLRLEALWVSTTKTYSSDCRNFINPIKSTGDSLGNCMAHGPHVLSSRLS